MKTKVTVTILGYHGKHNVGDDAILSQMISDLRSCYRGIRVNVISYDPIDTQTKFCVRAVHIKNIPKVLCAIFSSQLLILGGGGFWFDRLDALAYSLMCVIMAKIARKKTMFYAGGSELITKPIASIGVRILFRLFDGRTVRDSESACILTKAGVRGNLSVTADPVVNLKKQDILRSISFSNEIANFADSGHLIGVSLVTENDDPRFFSIATHFPKIIDYCTVQLGAYVILAPLCRPQGDFTVAQRVLEAVACPQKVIIIEPQTPHELVALASHFTLAIGMRYHFLLLSALAGVPFGSISRSPKVSALTIDLGQKEIGSVGYISETAMLSKVDDLWLQRERFKAVLRERLDSLRQRERGNIALALDLLHETVQL